MYEEYFGLRKKPFSIVPDPACLYMSDGHREALAHLLHGTGGDGGFVLLTGEVGAGKTTVCRRLLEMTPQETEVAFILNPRLTAAELLSTVCDEFGIAYPEGTTSIKALVDRINDYLLRAHEKGHRAVLIVEEAQNLTPEVLEQVRLLTNLETNQRKLLQVIMIGQPELRRMLASPGLSQLSQRVTARYHLGPLSKAEVPEYVKYRLSAAGLVRGQLFTPATMKRIYRVTKGIPRLINVVCDRALLGAFVEGKERVDVATLRKAAREVSPGSGLARSRRRAAAAGLIVFFCLAAGALFFLERPWTAREGRPGGPKAAGPPGAELRRPAGQTGSETREAAYEALFRAWGVPYDRKDQRPVADKAAAAGLQCVGGEAGIDMLREMNRPAALRLIDKEDGEYYAVLASLADDKATVLIGNEARSVAAGEITRKWSGDYLLLWRAPAGYTGHLRQGSRGPAVAWLERRLAAAQGLQAPPGEDLLYDKGVVGRVKEFQIGAGMVPDGIAGPRTIMRLAGEGPDPGPLLTGGKGTR